MRNRHRDLLLGHANPVVLDAHNQFPVFVLARVKADDPALHELIRIDDDIQQNLR